MPSLKITGPNLIMIQNCYIHETKKVNTKEKIQCQNKLIIPNIKWYLLIDII